MCVMYRNIHLQTYIHIFIHIHIHVFIDIRHFIQLSIHLCLVVSIDNVGRLVTEFEKTVYDKNIIIFKFNMKFHENLFFLNYM